LLVLASASTAIAVGQWSPPDTVDPAIQANAVSCVSTSFCVAVGNAWSFGSAAVYSDGVWSEASLLGPHSEFDSVSCTSTSFCMAVSRSGEAVTYDGSTWSATQIDAALTSVSCTTSSFCVAVGASGQSVVYRGSTWSAPIRVSKELSSVACVSESFCIAVGDYNGEAGYAVTYSGGTWSGPSEIDSEEGNALHSLSCVSSSFCVAVGNRGDEVTYNGSAWSPPTKVGILGYIQSVSCYSEGFCVAATSEGVTATYDGSTWSLGARLSNLAASGALSCSTESFCMAVGGYSSGFDGGTWTSPVPLGSGGLSSVSCPNASFCTAVDSHGRALTYDGSGWSAPDLIAGEGELASVSCTSAAFCAAVGGNQHGYALTYHGTAWSSPTEVDPEGGLKSVSCVSASFCVALAEHTVEGQSHGYALIYEGSSWSAPEQIDTEAALRAVSCASESFCVAVGGHDVVTYDGASWSAPSQLDAEGYLTSVSCTSAPFCVAVAEDTSGFGPGPVGYAQAFTYSSGHWSASSEIPNGPARVLADVASVSCVSFSFCMAAASFEGETAIFESGAWSAWVPLEVNADFSSVSCPSTSLCAAVDGNGHAFIYSSPASVDVSAATTPISGGPSGATPGPPVITAASLTHARFRVARQATAISAKNTPLGTSFHFTLSAVAKLQIEVTRPTRGLRDGRSCLKPTAKLERAHSKNCTRALSVATLIRTNEPAGADRIPFSGRVGRTALGPRGYTAVLSASSADGHSKPVSLPFVVVR
jgi:hypothetical protein